MLYKDEGFVIRRNQTLDTDEVVLLFLKDKGKIPVIAKGLKKITSRKSGNLDSLNYCKFSIAEGKSMDILTEVVLIDNFPNIKETVPLLYIVFYIAELINKCVYDGESNIEIFDLVKSLLGVIDKKEISLKKVITYFNIRLLIYLGHFADPKICYICNKNINENDKIVFNNARFAHSSCIPNKKTTYTTDIIKIFNYINNKNINSYVNLSIGDKLINSMYSISITMLETSLDSQIKSKEYIK